MASEIVVVDEKKPKRGKPKGSMNYMRKFRIYFRIAALIVFFNLVSTLLYPASTDEQKSEKKEIPITVEADHMEYMGKQNLFMIKEIQYLK